MTDDSTVMPGTATLLLSTLPSPPAPPEFPDGLDWGYDPVTGRYTLDEAGVDELLDFRDNRYGTEDTRGYRYDLATYGMLRDRVYERVAELGL